MYNDIDVSKCYNFCLDLNFEMTTTPPLQSFWMILLAVLECVHYAHVIFMGQYGRCFLDFLRPC